ncbi:MAG: DUF362 domain-containing protein [Negativicutes bacterium]|nr:DUF362 domain-containing protein [Negativicutes bacterium]
MQSNELHVIYGSDPGKMVYEVLTAINLAKGLSPDTHFGLKPNLVVARPAKDGATTSPEMVEGVIRYLRDNGFQRISIMEGSWVGDSTKRAFKVCGYEELSRQYNIPLHDLKDDASVVKKVGEIELKICKKPLEVDFLINMPVLKAHCQTAMTCALKNLKGCIPDSEKRRFHSMGLDKPIGYLGKALVPGLNIVDAINGDLTFEEGGNPVQMDRIIVGKDAVLVDSYAASLLGFAKADIGHIVVAERIGAGCGDLTKADIREYNVGLKTGREFRPSNRARQLAEKVTAREACSACYGGLIHALQRMSDEGALRSIKKPIYIGQGFRGQEMNGLGVGECAGRCSSHVGGCPPTARDIVEFLKNG